MMATALTQDMPAVVASRRTTAVAVVVAMEKAMALAILVPVVERVGRMWRRLLLMSVWCR